MIKDERGEREREKGKKGKRRFHDKGWGRGGVRRKREIRGEQGKRQIDDKGWGRGG